MQVSSSFRTFTILGFAVLACGLAAFAALGQLDADAAPAPVIRVGAPLEAPPVAPGFVGVSLEYSAVSAYAGNASLRPALARLIASLAPGQTPVLRIGGDSTDWSQVPVKGWRRPGGVSFLLTPHWLRIASALVKDLRAHVIVGINLEDGSVALARSEARALVSAFGRAAVRALEIGNEPELYGHIAWYTTRTGVHVLGRPASYDVADYLKEFSRLAAALPRVPLAGPATGGVGWMAALAPFVKEASRLGLVTVHVYPLQRCYTTQVSDIYPTIPHLLAPSSSLGLAARVTADVAMARARGVPLRVDEMNSVSCRGKAGVSNTYASALWALDALFALADEGVAGVNIHTLPGAAYQPFELVPTGRDPHGWRVNPMYYGLLAFADAVPPGSRLLALSGALQGLRTWALRTPTGQTRVVLINEGSSSRTVSLEPPASSGATVSWLRGPSLAAKRGVTLAGQSVATGTRTGRLAGLPQLDRLAGDGGYYTIRVPPASAAIVSFAP